MENPNNFASDERIGVAAAAITLLVAIAKVGMSIFAATKQNKS